MDGAPLMMRPNSAHHGTPRPDVSAVHTITVDTVGGHQPPAVDSLIPKRVKFQKLGR
jgi:hypothetical protein